MESNSAKTPFQALIDKISPKKANLFTKYFTMFVCIFSILLVILGSSLFILVNNYTMKDRTRLLRENVASISHTIENTLIMQDMNEHYSMEKEMICSTLQTVSQSIDADVFVCDVEGKIIMCGERAGKYPVSDEDFSCPKHDNILISSNILSLVYQQGEIIEKTYIFGEQCFLVGRPIYSGKNIIATVFAVSKVGVQTLTLEFLRIFVVAAFFCLILAFICIYYLTKKMVTPLERMSNAAKQFAVGDFSYRVKIDGNDELADLGKAFNDMADALDALESSRRSFVSNVSHELKTPMTSIAGFIDGILDGTIPRDKQDYYLDIVSTEVRRLSRLVVSMLNMSKIESGDLEMKPNKYDISEQIIHILLTFEQKIENKHIDIRGLDSFNQTQIVADPDMIYQAIYNLFDNAVKFTNDGGYIEVQLNDKGDFIEVNIINSGEGIQKEELSKIFERFYKVDKSRSLDAKGAGLGLYIVKLMIEMHGGKIFATSDSQNTAKFTFTLPKQYNPRYKKELKKLMNDFENNTNGAEKDESVESNTTYHYSYGGGYQQPQSEPYKQANYQPVYNTPEPPKKKKGKTAAIVISIILVVAIVLGVVGIFVAKNEGSKPNSGEDTTNSAIDKVETEEQDVVPETDKTGNYTVAGIAKNCIDSCVGITVYAQANNYNNFHGYGSDSQTSGDNVKMGEGSGIIMQEANGKTYILTCAHVISEGTSFKVTLNNGKTYEAFKVGFDSQTDIGVIAINASGLQVAKFANSDSTVLGEQVVAIGCPGGLNFMNSVTSGYVSALARPVSSKIGYDTECIQIDAAINPGNSGGALFNMSGQVIGVNSSKIASTDYEGMGFAVPSNTALETANSLIKVGYVEGRAKLGITYKSVKGYSNSASILSALKDLGFENAEGTMVINSIEEQSGLAGKGVKEYDMIVAVNGNTLTSIDVMTSLLADSKPGDTIKLTIARIEGNNIDTFDVECTLIESKG